MENFYWNAENVDIPTNIVMVNALAGIDYATVRDSRPHRLPYVDAEAADNWRNCVSVTFNSSFHAAGIACK